MCCITFIKMKYDRRTHIGIDNVRARLAAMVGGTLTIQSEKRPRDLCISVKLLRAVKLGSTKVATIAVEDFIREMDAGLIEYDHVTKKATRHRSKAKFAASQNK